MEIKNCFHRGACERTLAKLKITDLICFFMEITIGFGKY